jgi:hypothetical protein
MTKCRFALYDPAQHSRDGSYWAWRAEGLDLNRLVQLYYDAASKHLPPDPNRLLADEIWGGIAALDNDLVGVYRCFDGGRDRHGRPGRFVILATLLTIDEIHDKDLTPIFRCEIARIVADRAPRECPLPEPPSLVEDVELPPAKGDEDSIRSLLATEPFGFAGNDAIGLVSRAFHSLPAGRKWRCTIEPENGAGSRVYIERDHPSTRPPAGDESDGRIVVGPGVAGNGPRSPLGENRPTRRVRDDSFISWNRLSLTGQAITNEARRLQVYLPRLSFSRLALLWVALFVFAVGQYWTQKIPSPRTSDTKVTTNIAHPEPGSMGFDRNRDARDQRARSRSGGRGSRRTEKPTTSQPKSNLPSTASEEGFVTNTPTGTVDTRPPWWLMASAVLMIGACFAWLKRRS